MADDTLVAYTHDRAIDVVGTIAGMAGFHVNYSGVLPTGWDEFLVAPAAPYRVFA
jgi:methylmalonyl-CoA mutase cobalamin-binding subunit